MRLPVFFLLVIRALAQDPAGATSAATVISTDRPSIADSSAVVPKGVFQVENGLLETGGQPRSTTDLPASLIRLGLTANTELRLTIPDFYVHALTPVGLRSGFGDMALGVKQQLYTSSSGFQLAAVVSLSLPTGAAALSSHGYDSSLQLPWSQKLSTNWTMAGMLSVYAPSQNGSHSVVGESTVLFDRQLTKSWDAFAAYAGDFAEKGGPRHLVHFGTSYKISAHQQVDMHVGIGLSAAAPDHFVGIGYSFLFMMPGRW